MSRSPVGGDLPALDNGEPLLHRWFVIAMLILVPLGIGVVVWAFQLTDRASLAPAERRPTGTAEVTHDRGRAALSEFDNVDPGPSCANAIDIVGDVGSRSTGRLALSTVCQLLQRDEFTDAERGIEIWGVDGVLRFGVFERNGVESSARIEQGVYVIELNAKFEFLDATQAAPALIHELVHLGQGSPGQEVSADTELAAVQLQALACERLRFKEEPRSCLDARELLALEDTLGALVAAGYRRAAS